MSIAEEVLRELVELCDAARSSERLAKLKRGSELLKRLTQLKELIVLRVHDCVRNEKDPHVSTALGTLREDVAATADLLRKIEDTKFFTNAKHGKAAELRVRDIITDGMSLSTALAMAAVATGQQSAIDAALKKFKDSSHAAPAPAATSTPSPKPAADEPDDHGKGQDEEERKGPADEDSLSKLTLLCQEGNRFLLGSEGKPKDLERAFDSFVEAARRGYAPAQHQAGVMCEFGLGTKQDSEEAMRWYSQSAEQDLPEALFTLGCVFREGRCSITASDTKALESFERAGNFGHSEAMIQAATILLEGQGEESDRKAFGLLERAARAGNTKAVCSLGALHLEGRGTPVNPGNAFECFVSCASSGWAPAIVKLGLMYERGTWVDENPERAAELFAKAAQLGERSALVPLGRVLLARGEALHAKQILEDLGDTDAEALWLLGDIHEQGLLGQPQLEVAFQYYTKAAAMSHPQAITKLANFHFSGAAGVQQNVGEAIRLYTMAAELGDPQAQAELGTLFLEGTLVPQSLELAVKWLSLAAKKDNALALYSLGELFEEGRGVPQDHQRASECFARASELGHPLTLRPADSSPKQKS